MQLEHALSPTPGRVASRRATGGRVDRWIATAPQLMPRRDGRRRPWGTVHSRLDGSTRTACGEPCVLWHAFWDIAVDLTSASTCADCVRRMRDGADHTDVESHG